MISRRNFLERWIVKSSTDFGDLPGRVHCLLLVCFCFLSLIGCASLPVNNQLATTVIEDTENTRFAKKYKELSVNHPGESAFHLLTDGLDAFTARLLLIEAAEKAIDVQYYMIHNDVTGGLFINQLLRVADRGVRVRLLIDDMDLDGRDEGLAVISSHPNIELRVFNPFGRNTLRLFQYVTGFGKVTRRMHNKSMTVDNSITVVGGRNIGDEYFNANPSLTFGDLDVIALGPVVKDVSASFDQYWNNEKAYPIEVLRPDLIGKNSLEEERRLIDELLAEESVQKYRESLLSSNFAKQIREEQLDVDWGKGVVLSDSPEKLLNYEDTMKHSLAKEMSPYFDDIKKELLIFSPYFVPGTTGTKYLAGLSRTGVKVRIITNSLTSTDVGLVHAGYAKHRRALLRAGVELYEINMVLSKEERKALATVPGSAKASLHAKSFVLDREEVFVGSLNLDPRSVKENTEIGIMIDSDEVAEKMVNIFNQVVEKGAFELELKTDDDGVEFLFWHGWLDGQRHTWNFDPYTGFLRRFGIGLMGLLPIESQL